MAKIPQGILGGISGKIGGIIGSSWKGINVIKTKPLSVANPRTAAQVAQRNKFGNTVAFAIMILAVVIKPLWDRFASRQSGFNAFIQANVALFGAELPVYGTGFVISKGKMASTSINVTGLTPSGTDLSVNWTDDSGSGYKLATDIPFVVIINHRSGDVVCVEGAATRADETLLVDTGDIFDMADTVDIYAAFRRADGTIVSNTSSEQKTVMP